jgi:hypothetical protein
MKFLKLLVIFMFLAGCSSMNKDCKGSRVDFRNLIDGQEVSQEQEVIFKVMGMKVKPAGELVEGTGHHHLIINGQHVPKGEVVPADDNHIHFGKGQTSTKVKLEKGKNTLTLQFADGLHRSYGKKYSKTITVIAK